MTEEFSEYLRCQTGLINDRLDELLPGPEEQPGSVHQAMRYSIFAGGKRIRPVLTLSTAELVGGRTEEVLDTACALEMIHTYSLIHDDLPCMDDDDIRRGKPTLHKAFPEGIAVLAGDALHALAFEILASSAPSAVVQEVAQAIGSRGMIGGQTVDLESEGKELSPEEIEFIHRHKTGVLIATAVRAGALCCRADEQILQSLSQYGERIGLAFQIIDDILDVEGSAQILGKQVGVDVNRQKATYPRVFGLEHSRDEALRLISEAKEYLLPFGPNGHVLYQMADFIVQRIQ
jgi:geranylgeranyl diphosphate synthase type II